MNCNEAQQNLELALDGALTQSTQRLLQQHVSTCVLCKEKLEQLEGVRELLSEVALTPAAESLDARVMGSFRKHHAMKSPQRTAGTRFRDLFLGSFRVPVPIMAMLLIAAVAMVLLAYRAGRQNASYVVVNPQPSGYEPLRPAAAPLKIEKTVPADKTVPAPAIATVVRASASPHRRNQSSARVDNQGTEQPLKSSTVITSNSTSYSTVAVLKGFEPLPVANARIIKGEQR